jgi:hypothetical protein
VLRDDETYYGTRTRVTLSDERQSLSNSFNFCGQHMFYFLAKIFFQRFAPLRIACFDNRNDASTFHLTCALENELSNFLCRFAQRFRRKPRILQRDVRACS